MTINFCLVQSSVLHVFPVLILKLFHCLMQHFYKFKIIIFHSFISYYSSSWSIVVHAEEQDTIIMAPQHPMNDYCRLNYQSQLWSVLPKNIHREEWNQISLISSCTWHLVDRANLEITSVAHKVYDYSYPESGSFDANVSAHQKKSPFHSWLRQTHYQVLTLSCAQCLCFFVRHVMPQARMRLSFEIFT